MRKFWLRKMPPDDHVAESAMKARWMVQRESVGPGDTKNAMQRICRRYELPYSVLWSLRYRPPSDLKGSVFIAIARAYENERQRQIQLLQHEESITEARTWIGRLIAGEAEASGGAETGSVNDRGSG